MDTMNYANVKTWKVEEQQKLKQTKQRNADFNRVVMQQVKEGRRRKEAKRRAMKTFEGEGIATYANGDVYEGMFRDGKRQGEGVLRYATGEQAEGNWINGVLTTATPVQTDAPDETDKTDETDAPAPSDN